MCVRRQKQVAGDCVLKMCLLILVYRIEKLQTYERVTVEMVPRIIEEHLIENKPVEKWLAKSDYHNFYDHQERLVLANCGTINPEEIDEYILRGGYKALEKALSKYDAERCNSRGK